MTSHVHVRLAGLKSHPGSHVNARLLRIIGPLIFENQTFTGSLSFRNQPFFNGSSPILNLFKQWYPLVPSTYQALFASLLLPYHFVGSKILKCFRPTISFLHQLILPSRNSPVFYERIFLFFIFLPFEKHQTLWHMAHFSTESWSRNS